MRSPDVPIETTLDTTCAALGFKPPPAPVRLTFARVDERCVMYVHLAPGHADPVRAWVTELGPADLHCGSGDTLLRAEFTTLPPAWSAVARNVLVREVRLLPDQRAHVAVEGLPGPVQAFVEATAPPAQRYLLRRVGGASVESRALLTPRQRATLELAVREGYYELPRRIRLAALAQKAGCSAAALSERLRRAEARIIAAFMEAPAGDSSPPVARDRP